MQNSLTGATLTDAELTGLSGLCASLLMWQKRIEQLEIALADANANATKLSASLIPEKMADMGISEIKLKGGSKVTVNPFYAGGLAEGKEAEAVAWLDKHGHGGIVKRTITCPLQKGDKSAPKIIRALEKLGVEFQQKEGVHPQTFKAFLRELTEAGKSLPEDKFKVFIGKTTKITAAT